MYFISSIWSYFFGNGKGDEFGGGGGSSAF